MHSTQLFEIRGRCRTQMHPSMHCRVLNLAVLYEMVACSGNHRPPASPRPTESVMVLSCDDRLARGLRMEESKDYAGALRTYEPCTDDLVFRIGMLSRCY